MLFLFTDDLPLQQNYTDICMCSQKCDRIRYDVRTSHEPFSDNAIVAWSFSDSLPDFGFPLRNLRQWANLDIMNRNFTLHINKISRMYSQLRSTFYDLDKHLTSYQAEGYFLSDRFSCAALSLPTYETSMNNFTEWEMNSYYLNITATRSNNPRTDDFLTRLAHDIISNSNEMYRFVTELNNMVETFRAPVEALVTCFGRVSMSDQELDISKSLRNALSVINLTSSLTLAINESYNVLSSRVRSHNRFSWLAKKATEYDIESAIR